MDKNTLSQYGWVVIVLIVLAIMIGLASPFGNFVKESVMNSTDSFGQKIVGSLDSAGVDIESNKSHLTANHMADPNAVGMVYGHAHYADQLNAQPEDCFYSFIVAIAFGEQKAEDEAKTLFESLYGTKEDFVYDVLSLPYDEYLERVNLVDLSANFTLESLESFAADAVKVVFESELPDDSVSVVEYTDPMYAAEGEKVVAWIDDAKVLHIAANGKIVAPTNCEGLFYDMENIKTFEFNGVFDTSNVVNMNMMFKFCSALESINLSELDFSNVETMDQFFDNCHSIKTIDFRSVKAPKLTSVNCLFERCESLVSVDLRGFDASSITTLGRIFLYDDKLETVKISDSFDLRNVEEFDMEFPATAKVIFDGDYATFTELANGKFEVGTTVVCTDGTYVIA